MRRQQLPKIAACALPVRRMCRNQRIPDLSHIKQKFRPKMIRIGLALLGQKRRQQSPLAAILSRQPMGEAMPHECRRIMLKAHSHIDMLARDRVPDDDEETHDYLAHCIGVAQIRVCDIGIADRHNGGIQSANELLDTLNAAAQGLLRARRRHTDIGRWGIDGPGLIAIRGAIEIYETVLYASSAQQMEHAQTTRLEQLKAGLADRW